jgi:hypothetical protein
MLSVTTGTVGFGTSFSQAIVVQTEVVDPVTGETTYEQSTTPPVVTASFTDPGVVITTSPGSVTISGLYRAIINTHWTYTALDGTTVTSVVAPAPGTFKLITKVDSPVNLKETCIYTIDGESFTHTVDLGSYSGIATTLKSLLATV